jgi:hypothetical protein
MLRNEQNRIVNKYRFMVILTGGRFEEHIKMLERRIGWGIRVKRLNEIMEIKGSKSNSS